METPLVVMMVLIVLSFTIIMVSWIRLMTESALDGKIKSAKPFMVIFLASIFLFFAAAGSVVELNRYIKAGKGKCPEYKEIITYVPK